MRKRNQGFTLIELLVTSTIIIVLATIGFVSYTQAVKGSRDGKRKADMATVQQALVIHKQQDTGGYYPANAAWSTVMSNLGNSGSLSKPYPDDPKNAGSYVYTTNLTRKAFCICAPVEDPTKNGNSTGIGSSGVCSITSPSATTTFYCLANP